MMSFVLVIFFAYSDRAGGGVAQIEMPSMAACAREADKLAKPPTYSIRQVFCVDRRETVE